MDLVLLCINCLYYNTSVITAVAVSTQQSALTASVPYKYS